MKTERARASVELGSLFNILGDLLKGSTLKGDILIHGTEEALVPRTPPGDSKQEAVGLAWGPVGGGKKSYPFCFNPNLPIAISS